VKAFFWGKADPAGCSNMIQHLFPTIILKKMVASGGTKFSSRVLTKEKTPYKGGGRAQQGGRTDRSSLARTIKGISGTRRRLAEKRCKNITPTSRKK